MWEKDNCPVFRLVQIQVSEWEQLMEKVLSTFLCPQSLCPELSLQHCSLLLPSVWLLPDSGMRLAAISHNEGGFIFLSIFMGI